MKFMLTFSLKPETKARDEAIGRFKASGGRSPKGAKLLGRWTAADFSGGFDLLESDDVRALTEFSLMWMLRFWDKISYPTWQKLAHAVRTGEGQAQFGKFDKAEQQIFSAGVEAFSFTVAAGLATSYDFSRHRRVLDVGGGTGSFLVAVLRRYDALKGTLFELPGACAVARQRLAREPEGTRIEVVEGDVFKDLLPGGHDALIVANTVHVFSTAHNIELMRKIRVHVRPGARLLLADLWTDPTHTQPVAAALMSGEFLVIAGEGQAYSEEEAGQWLGQTGWQKLDRRPLAGAASLIVAEAK